ncbi:hypothetical protein G3A_15775 [Bacillus sp. 17376]|uniref:Uncharacterized protein n=1 Tax=Mesobacillus boroniphilus JCM 21738 TaxID=1294265 RepID=W4RR13_9BACI|nr:hypothetical protein G3A_15775 [Bacillus sp. 17376]GAE46880.1 hypothetical protein JCM21738_3808 [Mesobacillus boroniphilus JCM 21738]
MMQRIAGLLADIKKYDWYNVRLVHISPDDTLFKNQVLKPQDRSYVILLSKFNNFPRNIYKF